MDLDNEKCEHKKWQSQTKSFTSDINTSIDLCCRCPALRIIFEKYVQALPGVWEIKKDITIVEPFSKFNIID